MVAAKQRDVGQHRYLIRMIQIPGSWHSRVPRIATREEPTHFSISAYFRRCPRNCDLRRIHHHNDGSFDRRGYRGTPRPKDGNCFPFSLSFSHATVECVVSFRNTVNGTIAAWWRTLDCMERLEERSFHKCKKKK